MGPQLEVTSDRLEKLGIKPASPGLQGELFNFYTVAATYTWEYFCITVFLDVFFLCLQSHSKFIIEI